MELLVDSIVVFDGGDTVGKEEDDDDCITGEEKVVENFT